MQKLIKIRQKKNRVDGIIEIGDKMKKYITPILCSICLGFFMGFFLCNQYEGKADLKTVFSESEPLYFLQSGVYSSLESMQENVANLSNYIYTEEEGKYYVYIGITSSEANVDKLKGIYQQMGYSIYSKQLDVSNANFITFVKECDQMLAATTEQNAILKIEQEVLASYEKMVIQKH